MNALLAVLLLAVAHTATEPYADAAAATAASNALVLATTHEDAGDAALADNLAGATNGIPEKADAARADAQNALSQVGGAVVAAATAVQGRSLRKARSRRSRTGSPRRRRASRPSRRRSPGSRTPSSRATTSRSRATGFRRRAVSRTRRTRSSPRGRHSTPSPPTRRGTG